MYEIDEEREEEDKECTFRPFLIAQQRERSAEPRELDTSVFVQNSLEKFYLRMNKAREVKEEEEDFKRNMCGAGNNWVK